MRRYNISAMRLHYANLKIAIVQRPNGKLTGRAAVRLGEGLGLVNEGIRKKTMDYLNEPPWELIKQWAFESGFKDDGYGDPSCSEWDDLRRFAIRSQSAERERCAKLCDEAARQLRSGGSNHEASAVESVAEDLRGEPPASSDTSEPVVT